MTKGAGPLVRRPSRPGFADGAQGWAKRSARPAESVDEGTVFPGPRGQDLFGTSCLASRFRLDASGLVFAPGDPTCLADGLDQ